MFLHLPFYYLTRLRLRRLRRAGPQDGSLGELLHFIIYFCFYFIAGVAQLVEQRIRNA